jgi:hypothetical protein
MGANRVVHSAVLPQLPHAAGRGYGLRPRPGVERSRPPPRSARQARQRAAHGPAIERPTLRLDPLRQSPPASGAWPPSSSAKPASRSPRTSRSPRQARLTPAVERPGPSPPLDRDASGLRASPTAAVERPAMSGGAIRPRPSKRIGRHRPIITARLAKPRGYSVAQAARRKELSPSLRSASFRLSRKRGSRLDPSRPMRHGRWRSLAVRLSPSCASGLCPPGHAPPRPPAASHTGISIPPGMVARLDPAKAIAGGRYVSPRPAPNTFRKTNA